MCWLDSETNSEATKNTKYMKEQNIKQERKAEKHDT
jgi:hypothetical protein